MTPGTNLSFIRQSSILGIMLCMLITGYSLLHYPAIVLPLRVGVIYVGVFIIVLVSYVVIVLRLTDPKDSNAQWIASHGSAWGMMIAGCWWIEKS